MSETKWTPGPWQTIASVPEEGFEAYWIKAQPNRAMRGFTLEIGCVNGPQNREHEANARLIAAAPELYEALAVIVASLSHQDDEGLIEHAEPMRAARVALAKARGEA